MRLEIYTDGAAMNNGKIGSIGYAAVLLHGEETQEYAKGERSDQVSSNRAELLAIRLGLRKVQEAGWKPREVLVFSDSEWAVKSIRGEQQVNCHVELVQEIRALLRLFPNGGVNWVRGHCGHKLNEKAHTLAHLAAKRAERKRGRDGIHQEQPEEAAGRRRRAVGRAADANGSAGDDNPSPVGPDCGSLFNPPPHLPPLAQPHHLGPRDLPLGGVQTAAPSVGEGDCGGEARPSRSARGGRGEVGGDDGATGEAGGAAGRDYGGADGEGEDGTVGGAAGAPATARFAFLSEWVRSVYCGGPGLTGPVRERLTDTERTAIRGGFTALLKQWEKYSERCAWLYENEGCEGWAARDAATTRSGEKIAVRREELAHFCGVPDPDVHGLLEEVVTVRQSIQDSRDTDGNPEADAEREE